MREYDNWQDEYFNGERLVYDQDGNLIAIEREDGVTEHPMEGDG